MVNKIDGEQGKIIKSKLETTLESLSETKGIILEKPIEQYCTDTFELTQLHYPIHKFVISVIFRETECILTTLNQRLNTLIPKGMKCIEDYSLQEFVAAPVVINQRYEVLVRAGSIHIGEVVGEFEEKTTTRVYEPKLIEKLNLGESCQTEPLTQKGALRREIYVVPFINQRHYNRRGGMLRLSEIPSKLDMEEWCSYGGAYMSSDHLGKISFPK